MKAVHIHHGDSREVLRGLPDNSIDSVVTDPPYALVSIVKRFGGANAAEAKSEGASGVYKRASAGFMGKTWDTGETAFAPEFWAEVMRVLKPGGHVVAASGTRTYHRLACAIEDAGFEVRDMISWLYGSGFPKSHDVSKGIDKARNDKPEILAITSAMRDAAEAAGISRSMVDAFMGTADMGGWWLSRLLHRCACPTWDQWLKLKSYLTMGDALDAEVWRLNGRKGTPGEAWLDREVTGAVEEWADRANYALTSADGLRRDKPASEAAIAWAGWGTALKPACEPWVLARKPLNGTVASNVLAHGTGALNIAACRISTDESVNAQGRWPANVIHDGSDEVVEAFPAEAGAAAPVRGTEASRASNGNVTGERNRVPGTFHADKGSAARFFYSAKADADDRMGSKHPTVKPIDLMRYLVRLITPPGGVVLDPFAGSGSTGVAAMLEGFESILIEREAEYVADINRKVAFYRGEGRLASQEKLKAKQDDHSDLPLFGK